MIKTLCNQYGLYQLISDYTHFTEHSSSLIDLIFVSKINDVVYSEESDPFMPDLIR